MLLKLGNRGIRAKSIGYFASLFFNVALFDRILGDVLL